MMQQSFFNLLRCPVTRSSLQLQTIRTSAKKFSGKEIQIIEEGILFSADGEWFYPVIKGIPRLLIEAFEDYTSFFAMHLPDYPERKKNLQKKWGGLIAYVKKKNKRTKESFTQEWGIFNYEQDKTWDKAPGQLLQQFLDETDETVESIKDKIIFDAGCGNGLLNRLIAEAGAIVVSMDFSLSVERAQEKNSQLNAFFIQGDVQFPPVDFGQFDIVHSSGVLIATNNTELSFSCLDPCVKEGGKFSVWLYQPRKDIIHNSFNVVRRFTSKLPVKLQYLLYRFTIYPVSYVVKRAKGNQQNKREMMIDILDWLSPEFRHEHSTDEAASWFLKRNYQAIKVTTTSIWGFNIIGIKNKTDNSGK